MGQKCFAAGLGRRPQADPHAQDGALAVAICDRFLAHYNLSLRYWDLGEARQAIDEARESCKDRRARCRMAFEFTLDGLDFMSGASEVWAAQRLRRA